jgi:hypothetical protein
MDHPSLWGLVAFAMGAVSGFQALYDRYPKEYGAATSTLAGIGYMLLRGLLPGGIFLLELRLKLIRVPVALEAFTIGAGTEAFLRARFASSFKNSADPDSLKGPLDIVVKFEDIVSGGIGPALVSRRQSMIRALTKNVPFRDLWLRIRSGVETFVRDDDQDRPRIAIRDALRKYLEEMRNEYDALDLVSHSPADSLIEKAIPPTEDRRLQEKLATGIYMRTSRSDFRNLMKPPPPS